MIDEFNLQEENGVAGNLECTASSHQIPAGPGLTPPSNPSAGYLSVVGNACKKRVAGISASGTANLSTREMRQFHAPGRPVGFWTVEFLAARDL